MSEEKMSDAKKTGFKRTPMAEQSPDIRIRNFDEVPLGYSPGGEARAEAAALSENAKSLSASRAVRSALTYPALSS